MKRKAVSSDWVKVYQEHFSEQKKQGFKPRSYPTYLPFFIILSVAIFVGIGLLHVWVCIQPVFLGHILRKRVDTYQYLQRKSKRLSLEVDDYQRQAREEAQEKLEMYFPHPNEVIKLRLHPPRSNP